MATNKKVARSFIGKKVFVGIDVHRQSYSVTAVCEREVVWHMTMPARPEVLIEHLRKRFEGAEVETVYEAGFSGFVLHRALARAGYSNIVVNPASIEVAANDKVKTDKRDSRRMAFGLEKGDFKGIRVPSEEEERARALSRTRDQLVENRTAVMNQIRMKLLQFGLFPIEHKGELSFRQVETWLKECSWEKEIQSTVGALLEVWRGLNAQVKALEKDLRAQASTDPLDRVYQSVLGIGALGARTLSNELGDMLHFSNERKLASFCGLTPSEYTTGGKVRRGHITRQGSGRIRRVLVQCAWAAIRRDEGLRAVYNRIAARAQGKRAIVAVARKLIIRVRALFKSGQLYNVETNLQVAA